MWGWNSANKESLACADHCVRASWTARGRRSYRLCALEDSDSDEVVLGVIVEEMHGSGVGLASGCNGSKLTMDAFGLSGRLYGGLETGVPIVVARLSERLYEGLDKDVSVVANEADVLHELGTGLSTIEVRLGVVGVGD